MKMITRFVKILVGVGVALIIAHSVLDVLDLDMILPAAITFSVIIFIGSVLWKKGVLPNSISSSSRGTTRYKANEYTSSSTSAPRAKRATKAAKPKKSKKPKCKWAGIMRDTVGGQQLEYCYCKSPGGKTRSRYSGISGVKATGSSNYPQETGNDWTLSVGGKCWHSGITPSKGCQYYRTR